MGKKFNWKRSSVLRKSVALIQRAPKMVRRWSASDHQYRATPPILANSFPKSGTHLLVQILEAFPGTRSCGGFWASMPSVTFRERTKQSMVKSIRRCVPGELVSGHLFYAPEFTAALAERNVVHFFIYRDPRDVVVSEAHYLATMN